MSAPYSPLWMRRGSYAHRDLRVSDAERAEVADRLSKHYSDGRLDQAEFDERVDQAMRAKTQSDLSGLFDDLPSPGESEPSQAAKNSKVAPRRRAEAVEKADSCGSSSRRQGTSGKNCATSSVMGRLMTVSGLAMMNTSAPLSVASTLLRTAWAASRASM